MFIVKYVTLKRIRNIFCWCAFIKHFFPNSYFILQILHAKTIKMRYTIMCLYNNISWNYSWKCLKFCFHGLPKICKWLFYYHFWSFFVKYTKIFHKNKVPMIILRCLTCLNLNRIKIYVIKHKYFCFQFLQVTGIWQNWQKLINP